MTTILFTLNYKIKMVTLLLIRHRLLQQFITNIKTKEESFFSPKVLQSLFIAVTVSSTSAGWIFMLFYF